MVHHFCFDNANVTNHKMQWYFVRCGSIQYGSGEKYYILLAILILDKIKCAPSYGPYAQMTVVFDSVGLVGFKSRPNAYCLEFYVRSFSLSLFFHFLPLMCWLCGVPKAGIRVLGRIVRQWFSTCS